MSEAVEVLIEEIRSRTEQEAKKILDNAKKKAEEIIKDAESKVKFLFDEKAKAEIGLLRRKIIGNAELQGRFMLLKAKDEVIKHVENLALDEIKRIISGNRTDYDYSEILYNMIKEAARSIDEDYLIIDTNNNDYEYLKNNLSTIATKLSSDIGKKITLNLSKNNIKTIGGVVISNKDRTKIYYNTLESRFAKKERLLRELIGKMLFRKET